MFEKRFVCAVDELVIFICLVDYQSRHASETLSENVWATTYLSTSLVNFIIVERKQNIFNTE
jgi:hypothetical protein